MNRFRTPLLRAVLVVTAALFASTSTVAQDYPNRPIRIVNPYAPGGSTDPVVRPIAEKMTEALGQAVIVENKPGAGTNVGSELVAKSKPDGYTLLLATTALATSPALYKKLNYDPVKDLQPVVSLIYAPFALVVSADLPVRSVQELIAYARANPGKLNYGSSGNGGPIHLGMELFKSITKTDIVHVPFKGSGESIKALLSGEVQIALSPPVNFVQHEKAGRARMLAIASPKRVPGLELSTVAESGVPGFTSGVWMALFAPAGTPRPIVDKINAAVNRGLQNPDVVRNLNALSMTVEGGTVEDITRMYLDEVRRWPPIVKAAGLSLD
ncbi:Bug family tripartite tricarboxylate transporter substrate binding protein [Ramlibacter sp.]|uniref:Bug family tripartite tricarboxylate transporter substrate binding protein n=1 Tax=Ramlibacter sp. TaxID=1917967 RepID=UPI003D137F51